MSNFIPRRSTSGCLTCKRRNAMKEGHIAGDVNWEIFIAWDTLIHWPPHAPISLLEPRPSRAESLDVVREPSPTRVILQELRGCLSSIPQGIRLDSMVLENVTSLILSQYGRVSQEVLFRAPLVPVEEGSPVSHKSFGSDPVVHVSWGPKTSTPNEPGPSLEGRLNSLYDLMCLGSLISGTATGHLVLRWSTPMFLQLAAIEPQNLALALGTSPQLQYDTTSLWTDKAPGHYMEWIHGVPVGILIILAKINAWRALRMTGEVVQNWSSCHGIEGRLNNWNPIVDHTEEPSNDIARLAIQEAWRQAALIYMYMGISEVNSADPRVEKAVRQVVQIGNTITVGSPFERHLLVPCIIAGVGARRERHRAALRSKIVSETFRTITSGMAQGLGEGQSHGRITCNRVALSSPYI
ncbi:hypothetical protein OPQ81_000416 [Rhizoctonia solani]|nr:hypothetical protein OPQ81_000416 [Rhizoctonia solani]